MTHLRQRYATIAATFVLAMGVSMPSHAWDAAAVTDLRENTAALEDRAVVANISLVSAAEPTAIEESILTLENDLQFPSAGLVSAASSESFNAYQLFAQASATRDTMVLRACAIAETAGPDASVWFPSYATVANRINEIHSALRRVVRLYVPTVGVSEGGDDTVLYDAVSEANAEAEAIMAALGDVEPLNPDYLMSTWYYNSLVDVIWQNASDVCETYTD